MRTRPDLSLHQRSPIVKTAIPLSHQLVCCAIASNSHIPVSVSVGGPPSGTGRLARRRSPGLRGTQARATVRAAAWKVAARYRARGGSKPAPRRSGAPSSVPGIPSRVTVHSPACERDAVRVELLQRGPSPATVVVQTVPQPASTAGRRSSTDHATTGPGPRRSRTGPPVVGQILSRRPGCLGGHRAVGVLERVELRPRRWRSERRPHRRSRRQGVAAVVRDHGPADLAAAVADAAVPGVTHRCSPGSSSRPRRLLRPERLGHDECPLGEIANPYGVAPGGRHRGWPASMPSIPTAKEEILSPRAR